MKYKNLLVLLNSIFIFFSVISCQNIPQYEVLEDVCTIHDGCFILLPKGLTRKKVDLICADVIKKYPGRDFELYSDKDTIEDMKRHLDEDKMDYDLTDVMLVNWIGLIDDRSGEYKLFTLLGYNLLK